LIFKNLIKTSLFFLFIFFCNEISSGNLESQLNIESDEENSFFEKKLINDNDKFEREDFEIFFSDLYTLLLAQNKELIILRSQIEQSQYNFNAEKSSWFPKIGITSSELPKFSTGSNFEKLSSTQNSFTNKFEVGANLNLEWDFINPARRLDIDIAFKRLNNSSLNYENKIKELFLKAAEIFFLIQESSQNIEISKKSLETSTLALEEANNRFNSGIGNKLDVLEAKTQYGRDKIALIKRVGELKLNENKLSKILNLMPHQRPIIKDESKILSTWNVSIKKSIDSAIDIREDLKIKKNNIEINKKEAFSVLSGKKPKLTIYNTYSISSSTGQSGVADPNHDNYSNSEDNTVGMKFSWNLFDGGSIKNSYKSLNEKTIELEESYLSQLDQLEKDIKDAYINLEVYKENIMESFYQFKSAEESLFLALKRLEAGLTTQREVVNNQGDLTEAESNFVNAITDYNKIILSLKRLTGLDSNNICFYDEKDKDYFIDFVLKNNLGTNCEKEIIKNNIL
tara:strand:- start:1265 stop:2800 length:1536 start_codon:yes stop_codon:yes gene_type:complete